MKWINVKIYVSRDGIDPLCGRLYCLGIITGDGSNKKRESSRICKLIFKGRPRGINVADKDDPCVKLCLGERLVKLVHHNNVPIGRSLFLALLTLAMVIILVCEPNVEEINVFVVLCVINDRVYRYLSCLRI